MTDAPLVHRRAGIMDAHGRGRPSFLIALIVALGFAAPAGASHDPNRSITVYVHGFERAGADRHGVYGADIHEALEDSLAAMAGLTAADTSGVPMPPDAVTATTYYGDTAPTYSLAADR